ncbi:MAG: AAA family ATPase [Phenylobacterium sp.]
MVVGASGAGKSTFARALAGRLGAPHIEIDALNWAPGWRNLSREDPDELLRRVRAAIAAERWTSDGNYTVARPTILARATHMVWLDYDRAVVMGRVIRRSFARALVRAELWPGTGNREDFGRWLRKDHPIRWAWDTFDLRRETYAALFADPSAAHVAKHRLRHPREAEPLLRRLAAEA